MTLSDLTRDAVLRAIEEFDSLGRGAFLRKYSFQPARSYFLILGGRQYDSKALVGAAHGYLPGRAALAAADFSGAATAKWCMRAASSIGMHLGGIEGT